MALFRSLRQRSFAFLWIGQTTSNLGDRVHRIALQWWVLEHTGSAAAMAMVFALMSIAMVAFLLVGGVVVDRMSRTRVMLTSDVTRGVLTAALAVLVYLDQLTLGIVYVFAVLWGFVEAFFQPAYEALLQEMVPLEDLPSANALTTAGSQVAGIVGPGFGAVFIASGHMTVAFAVDSLSFFLSAVALLAVGKTAPPSAPPEGPSSVLREVRQGLSTVLANPWLWITMLAVAIFQSFDFGLYDVALPYVMVHVRDLEVGDLATVQTASAIGSVLCAIWVGRQATVRRRALLFYGAALVLACCFAGFGLAPTTYAIAAVASVRGVATNMVYLTWIGSMQTVVPQKQFGRVVSLDIMLVCVFCALSYWGFGWALDHVDSTFVFVGGAAFAVGYVIVAWLHPKVRSFD